MNSNIPKISYNSVTFCEESISIEELKKAVNNLKANKSPGTDGLTAEFYQFFFENIKDYLYDSINYSFQNKILSTEQRRGILKLIPKKDKDLTNMRSFRPISLLNTDYKIITHILASRLQKVLPEIISTDQNGYLQGRFIGHNIRSIIDTMQHIILTKQQAYLLFLDFEKAFDKLDHKFLINALHNFGFEKNYIQWIKILYTDIQSCILNNGYTSPYFHITAGIRQGCPISALLFIIAVECLSIYIKNNNSIKGIIIGGVERKITQLADDTTLFLRDIGSNSANEVLQEYICLNKFIEINNKMVLDEEFIRLKTLKIGDIVKNNGRFLTHEEFQRKFKRRINWLKLHSVTLAIPNKWRQILNMNTSFENIEIGETRITMLNNVSSKKCYWSLVKKVITKPTCINSWDAKGFVFNDETWKKLFLLPKFTTYNIKIKMLQYKILHRIYASKSKVSKFVREISGKCEYCNIEKNIVHTFYECEEIKTFWQNFKTWFNHITNINLELRIEDIIFGIHRTIPFNTVINFCILIGKFFIHMCNNDRKTPSLMDYIPTLKHHLSIEKQVYDRKGKSGKFCMLFGQLHANICS